jgi:hypothetical protein
MDGEICPYAVIRMDAASTPVGPTRVGIQSKEEFMKRLFLRYPILMAISFGIVFLFAINTSLEELISVHNLSQTHESLSLAEIGRRMNQGSNELNVEIGDGQIVCSRLSYLETTYALVYKEYTAYTLITNTDHSIVLFAYYKGTPSCEELGSSPIAGIVLKMEDAAKAGMYKTNLMGIREYPNAEIFRFCGNCTKESKNTNVLLYFGFSAVLLLGFIFSLYFQWKKWTEEEKTKSNS